MSAQVTRRSLLYMQVCVPTGWTDEQATVFAEKENPAGTTYGWRVCKAGSTLLKNDPERVTCEDRTGHVHIVLNV